VRTPKAMDQRFEGGLSNVERLSRLLVAQGGPGSFIPQERLQRAEGLAFAQRGLFFFQPARGAAEQLQGPARVIDRFRGEPVFRLKRRSGSRRPASPFGSARRGRLSFRRGRAFSVLSPVLPVPESVAKLIVVA